MINTNTNNRNRVISFHGYNASPESKLEQKIQNIIIETLGQDTILETPYLAGHTKGAEMMNTDATIPNIMQKALSDINEFTQDTSNHQNTYLVGTSTGANPILTWASTPQKPIAGICLIKPLIDLEHSVGQFAQTYNGVIQQIFGKDFYDFIGLEEYKQSQQGALTGTPKNPIQITTNTQIYIISGEKDTNVGNGQFIYDRIQTQYPDNLRIFELKDSIHGDMREGEIDEIKDIMKTFFEETKRTKQEQEQKAYHLA